MAGRPSDYTPEIAEIFCERIALGESVRAIVKYDEMPPMTTVFRWLRDNESFRQQYARAKELQAEHYADELMSIVDDASGDVTGELEMPNAVAVQRAKLRYEARKWVISKLLAKKYGDKVQHTGEDNGPIQFVVTRAGQKEK